MLYFVIPLRPACTTPDWRRTGLLLERTLASACAQVGAPCRALVVGHERPEGIVWPSTATFITAPFAPPDLAPAGADHKRRVWLMASDKGRKLLCGLQAVRADGDAWVMFLDADDLVSNRLATFAAQGAGTGGAGWYFDRGYRWDEKLPYLLFPRRRFYHECGSSYILRVSRAPFPDRLDYTLDMADYYVRRYEVHAYVRENMENLGHPLDPLPFPGAIYTFHDQNIYARSLRRPDSVVRTLARCLVKGRWITPHTRAEFGIRCVDRQKG